jgi:hypothetical protein
MGDLAGLGTERLSTPTAMDSIHGVWYGPLGFVAALYSKSALGAPTPQINGRQYDDDGAFGR